MLPEKKELEELLKDHSDLHRELLYIFKKEDQALIWLVNTKAYLSDDTPISLIHDVKGKEKVMDLLYRIKTGDLS